MTAVTASFSLEAENRHRVGKLDIETDTNGLTYMRARYYSPEIKQFANEDPVKDGLNWYGYVNGNPKSFVDPSGLMTHHLRQMVVAVEDCLRVMGS